MTGQREPLRRAVTEGGFFAVDFEFEDQVRVHDLAPESPQMEVAALDASRDCARMLALAEEPNFDDLLNGVEAYAWSDRELRDANYVVGKHYTSVSTVEIEDPAREDEVLPVIGVSEGGAEYDFRTMGLGEFAALVTLWRLRQAKPGTVVLLEEPETYLSARASVALLDVLAARIDKSRLYGIVTTHSPGVMSHSPLEQLLVLVPGDDGSIILRAPGSRHELDQLLGVPAGNVRLVLVEDETARTMVEELMARYVGVSSRSARVAVTGGAAALDATCRTFPPSDALSLVGVLDGDQALPEDARWPVLALPGRENPDAQLRSAASGNVDGFAAALGRPATAVRAAVSSLVGADEHDWFHELAAALSIRARDAVRAALAVLLEDPEISERCGELATAIMASLDAGPAM
jgi:AAA domain, putative AbiEii toxin, Type IV TA system